MFSLSRAERAASVALLNDERDQGTTTVQKDSENNLLIFLCSFGGAKEHPDLSLSLHSSMLRMKSEKSFYKPYLLVRF